MTRTILCVSVLLSVVACGGQSLSDSAPAQCLVSAGYEDVGDGRTFLRDDVRVTLAEFQGSVQPVGEDDLTAYVQAGCQ